MTGRGERREAGRRVAARGSFDAFYEGDWSAVVAVTASLCGDLGVAEEIAQEAFLRAYGRWDRIAGLDRPDLWVRRVATNLAISRFRRVQAEARALARSGGRRSHRDDPAPVVEAEPLWLALRALPPKQAQVAALFYVDDRSVADIATSLDCAEGTVRSHLHAARHRLRATLETGAEDVR